MGILKTLQGNRPDITPAQLVAAGFAAVQPVCVLVGAHLSTQQVDALGDLRVVAVGLVVGDAAIRIGRNVHDAKVSAAGLVAANGKHSPPALPPAGAEDVVLEEDGLPTDDDEFAAPPTTTPVQPSQVVPEAETPA